MTMISADPTSSGGTFGDGTNIEPFRGLWRNNRPLDDLFPDNPFSLDKGIGPLEANQPSDVAKVQSLLHDAGYLDANQTEGPTGIYSHVLMDGPIRNFQSDNGLAPDGVVNPAGPTITKLEEKLRPALNEASGRDIPLVLGTVGALAAPEVALPILGLAFGGKLLLDRLQRSGNAPDPTRRQGPDVLPRTLDPGPPISGTPPTRSDSIDPHWFATPGFPSKPPLDPHEENQKKPIKPIVVHGTELPATTLKLPHVFIFPDLTHEIEKLSTINERNETDRTRAQIDAIRDLILARHPDWTHIGGGRDKGTGKDLPEYRLPGPGQAWKDVYGWGDTRPGSSFIDLTFETPSGRLVHIQTVDANKNGIPSDRELRAFKRISEYHAPNYPGADVYLIPKEGPSTVP